jgi:hypothetical protein
MPEGVGYPGAQPGPEVTAQVGPPAVQEGSMAEGVSPYEAIQNGYGSLAPDERAELDAAITPRMASLFIRMMPELEPMLQQFLRDDLMGVPEIGMDDMVEPSGALGGQGLDTEISSVPDLPPDPGMPPPGVGDNFGGGAGGGDPANEIAGIYTEPKKGNGGQGGF